MVMARRMIAGLGKVLLLAACVFSTRQQLSKIQRTIASIGMGSAFFAFSSQPSLAINTDASTSAAGNVLRVAYSLKLIDKSITDVGDVKLVVNQIGKLMQNYKLKDNLQLSLDLVDNKKRDEARGHGQAAFEDLSLVSEYFSDEIDDMSGKKKIPREVLQFAAGASVAAQKELEEVRNSCIGHSSEMFLSAHYSI